MAQFLRPRRDGVSIGTWHNDKGLDNNIFISVDNVVANDGEYITSFEGIKGNKYRCELTTTSVTREGPYIIRYRVKRTSGDGNIHVSIALYDGQSVVYKSASHPLNNHWTQYALTVPSAESVKIGNNMFIELKVEESEGINDVGISWIEVEIPNGDSDYLSSKGMNMTKKEYEKLKIKIEESLPPIGTESGPKLIMDAYGGRVYQAQDQNGEWWTLKGECCRCGECCDHSLVEGYEDRWKCNFMRSPGGKTDDASALYQEVVDGEMIYGCKLHFSKPWGCRIYPSDPDEKLFPSCSYSWEKAE